MEDSGRKQQREEMTEEGKDRESREEWSNGGRR